MVGEEEGIETCPLPFGDMCTDGNLPNLNIHEWRFGVFGAAFQPI